MYTNLIAPTDPTKADTLDNTYGDPVDIVKQVFEHYSVSPSVNAGGGDPELNELYNEFYLANILSVLIDPLIYKMVRAFDEQMRQQLRLTNPWLYQSDVFAWAYTSHFNPGALGYEIQLTQHFRINKHYLRAYIKVGRPFTNLGVGIANPKILNSGKFTLGTEVDIWDQDVFGKGGIVTLSSHYRFSRGKELTLDLHWKDEGYIVGH
ncbi:MAG: hypothetical protein OEX12_13780 [Gammaproteobacteria bacterium]|nr:hypothetical protein [Gammaproteobacteria bacterium]